MFNRDELRLGVERDLGLALDGVRRAAAVKEALLASAQGITHSGKCYARPPGNAEQGKEFNPSVE
jgi:hypothetical protein